MIAIPAFVSEEGLKSLVKASVKEAEAEREQEKERKTLVVSHASFTAVQSYLEELDILVLEQDSSTVESTEGVSFEPFTWIGGEEACIPSAMLHFEQELKKFGVRFGTDNFKFYDVHSKHQLLNINDEKSGKLSGGIDLILGPHGLSMQSVIKQSCVAVELKTSETLKSNGIESFLSQATLELIASCYHSHQMSLVVLTDLASSVVVLTLSRSNNGIEILQYGDLTLNQMATFVRQHLSKHCTPDRTYRLNYLLSDVPLTKPAEQTMQAFKRRRVSSVQLSPGYEQFSSMLEETELGSRERAEVIQNFFHSNNLHSSYLSMFVYGDDDDDADDDDDDDDADDDDDDGEVDGDPDIDLES